MSTKDRRARIVQRVAQTGRVRLSELAVEFQVSEMTIRRDLDQLAADHRLVRIRGGAERPRFDAASRQVAGRAEFVIGIVLPTSDYVYRSILSGVGSALAGENSASSLLVSNYSVPTERKLVEELLARGVDGLLFTPTIDEDKLDRVYLDWMTRLPVPTVLIDRRVPDSWPGGTLPSVRTSFTRGLIQAVGHLTQLGHSRIPFFGHLRRMSVDQMQKQWDEIISGFDLSVRSSPFIVDKDYRHWQSSVEPERVVAQLRDVGATALVCRNDPVALTMVHHMRRSGMWIPDDMSIVTYDDEMATMCDPPLTAIAPPKEELGRRACELLLELIRNRRAGNEPLVVQSELEPRLVVRASTAPPPIR